MREIEHFIAQYNQAWEQKRHHAQLIWVIPPFSLLVISFVIIHFQTYQASEEYISVSKYFFIGVLLLFCSSVIMLVFRHEFFQEGYGLLIRHMQRSNQPLDEFPVTGRELNEFLKTIDENLSWYSNWGNYWSGVGTLVGMLLGAFVYFLFFVFGNSFILWIQSVILWLTTG